MTEVSSSAFTVSPQTLTAPAYEVWLDDTPSLTPILIIVPKKTLYGGGSIAPATDLIVYRRESGGQLTLLTYTAGTPVTNQYKLTGNVGPFTTAHNGDQTITVTDGIAQQLGHRLVSPGHYSPAHRRRRLGVLTLRLRPLRGALRVRALPSAGYIKNSS